jgi:hypothetical protein
VPGILTAGSMERRETLQLQASVHSAMSRTDVTGWRSRLACNQTCPAGLAACCPAREESGGFWNGATDAAGWGKVMLVSCLTVVLDVWGKGRLSSTPHHRHRLTTKPSVHGSVTGEAARVGPSNTPGNVTDKKPCQPKPPLRSHGRLVGRQQTYLSNTRSRRR